MFIPNTTCTVYEATATLDIRGERAYKPPRFKVPCAVVNLDIKVDKTSVRADSSGSRGKAEEEQGTAKLLFPTNGKIAENDIVVIEDVVLQVIEVFPRRNVLGKLDHYQVELRKSELP